MDCKTTLNDKNEKQFDPNRPYVISSQRYDKLVELSTAQNQRAKQEARDLRIRNMQRIEGEALNSKFTGKKVQTLQDKLASQKADLQKKAGETAKQLNVFKENDDRVRREKIKKAEQMIEKSKPGPRMLHCAAIQSEVLRERNLQIAIKKEFDKIMCEEQERIAKGCVSLNNPWIPNTENQIAEKMENIRNYKKEMLKTIEQNAKQKYCNKKRLLEEQRAERDRIDREIKCQIEREKLAMETKRNMLRQNAIEAMKMVEQRRQREHMIEEIEDRLNCVYNNGKRELDNMVKANTIVIGDERAKKINENAKNLPSEASKQLKEDERVQRDIKHMELKFTEAEMEKKRKEKAAKQARIEAHLQYVETQKKIKHNCCEQQLFDMAQRFKNDEVNNAFMKSQSVEKLRQLEQFRAILKEQLAEKERKKNEEQECLLDDPYMQDDQKFFELARKYITDAKDKDRPLYPFIKAVEEYKRENQIDCVRTLPKHLLSKILIGCRQAETNKKENELPNINANKQKTLEECLKTTELLNTAWQKERSLNERPGVIHFGPPGGCSKTELKRVPSDRFSPSRENCATCVPTSKDNAKKNEDDQENAKQIPNGKTDCEKDKIRYSMSHLKYICKNQNAKKDSRIWY